MKSLTMVAALLIAGTASFGQISVDQANQKLHEKQKEQAAERSRPVTITQGELDDMMSEITKLKAEVQELRARAVPPAAEQPAALTIPGKIAVGMTREQLLRFIKAHKDRLEMTSDLPTQLAGSFPAHPGTSPPTTSTSKTETIILTVKAPHDVVVGTHSNGPLQTKDVGSELRPDSTLTIVLLNDVVASLSDEKLLQ
jgi:hypothetical protein